MSAITSLAATHPHTNATVSASAGSGKTWLLVTRIIRLLLAGAEPGNILALTFTRKAAAEMQMRLHERLYAMTIADEVTLTRLLTAIDAPLDNNTQQIATTLYESVVHALHPVRLQTFHAFCQDILSRFPLEADIPPGFELLDDSSLLLQQAWEAMFAEATENTSGTLAQDLDYLMQMANGPANTRTALTSLLRHRSDWWAYTENQSDPCTYASRLLRQQLALTEASNPTEEFFEQINRDLLDEFAELLRKHATRSNGEHADTIESVTSARTLDTAGLQRIQTVFLTAKQEPRARKPSKAQENSLGAAGQQRLLELHAHICDRLLHALDALQRLRALEINHAWYRAGHRFIEIFQRLKRELRILDFTDLEWNCYRLLNASDNALWVQYKVDQRIDHILIDEFQDTNPTQWQLLTPLLEEIAASPEQRWRSVFLVGDEKQSIYSFRRANPALQSQASQWLREHLAAQEAPLDFSWRSSPAIIEFVNQVFSQPSVKTVITDFTPHGTHLKDLPGEVCLTPLFQQTQEPVLENTQAMELRNSLLQPRPDSLINVRTHEAEHIAKQIQQLVNQPAYIETEGRARAVDYGDIMVLIRNRTHVADYENVFRQHNIPYLGSQRGSLLDNLEIQDLEKLLDSLITPFDNLAIAQVLRSPMFSASDEDLITLASIDGNSHWYERLLALADDYDAEHPLARAAHLLPRWRELADTVPVHDLLDRIYAESNLIERYLAASTETQKAAIEANLERFLELSLELDSGRYPSLSHFLHYLRSMRKHADNPPDEPNANTTHSRVRILTIHASKGLEAPVVFLVDSNNTSSNKNAYTALVDWPAHSNKPTLMQLVTDKTSTDNITKNVQTQKSQAEHREELNLLYVALTRARQYLFISGVESTREAASWYPLVSSAMREICSDDELRYNYTGKQAPISTTNKAADVTAVADVSALRQPMTELPASEILIAPSREVSHLLADCNAADAEDFEWLQQRGIAIHRALDLLSREHALNIQAALQQVSAELALNADNTELQSWINQAAALVSNKQLSTIFRPTGSIKTYNEMPLLYTIGKNTVYGSIDRLIVHDDHVLLIDYKTHQNATPQNLAILAQPYQQQIHRYRDGAQRLWPKHKIKTGLLFTECAEIIWLDDELDQNSAHNAD